MSSDDLPNYVAYRWFYFPYGWGKQKMRDIFEALVKDITQKFRTLVNSLLNRKKKKKTLVWIDRILRPSWITLHFGRQCPGTELESGYRRRGGVGKGPELHLRCLSHTTEAAALLDRHLAISGQRKAQSSVVAASSVWMTGLHVSENISISPHPSEKTPKVYSALWIMSFGIMSKLASVAIYTWSNWPPFSSLPVMGMFSQKFP